ncbi:MAG: hypothetical protein KC474_11890 [Cyanobacteria bacterium HKST-UBA04]|nr:hypothetical protein [Cyanobacteria bacterium HKST-UBA04]
MYVPISLLSSSLSIPTSPITVGEGLGRPAAYYEGVRNKEKILFTLSSSEVSIYGYADKLVEEKENAVSSYVIKMEK